MYEVCYLLGVFLCCSYGYLSVALFRGEASVDGGMDSGAMAADSDSV